jgi:hypothetical protein
VNWYNFFFAFFVLLFLTDSFDLQQSLRPVPSTQMRTPEGSIIVTLSTPRGSAHSARSSLRTETSESTVTERNLSRDIDRLADDLRRYDDARGDENREIADNVRALRNELHDLSEFLHRTPSPPAASVHIQPVPQQLPQSPTTPRVQRVDQRVGGSSVVSSLLPGDRRRLTVTSGQLTRASSSGSSIGSFLSSHHSDDDLMVRDEFHPDSPLPWNSPLITESDDSSSMFSESSSPDSGPYAESSESSGRPYPPSSPTPSSSTSTVTIRPLPTSPDLLGPLNAIRDQLNALWDGQTSTNHMLDNLRDRPVPHTQDNTELSDRLHRIEDLLQSLLSQGLPREHQPVYEGIPQGPESIVSSDDSLERLRFVLRGFEPQPDAPAMPVPVTARGTGPSLVQQLDEILSSGMNLPSVGVQQPPVLIPFTYEPTRGGDRPRSASPVSLNNLPPRPETEPPLSQVHFGHVRNVPRRREPRRPLGPRGEHSEGHTAQGPPVIPVHPSSQTADGGQAGPSGPYDIDFEHELRDRRMGRHPGTDGTFTVNRPPVVVCRGVSCRLFLLTYLSLYICKIHRDHIPHRTIWGVDKQTYQEVGITGHLQVTQRLRTYPLLFVFLWS